MVIFFSDNGANGHPRTAYPGQTDEYLNSFDNSLPNRGLKNSYIDMGPGWAQASMAPSRMFKAFTAEGGIRAPFVVKLPGAMSNAGTMNHSFFHVRDIMPTILDIAGISHTQEVAGRQVVPMHLLEGTIRAGPAGGERRDSVGPVGRLGAPGMDEWRRVQVPYGASWRQP